MLLTVMKTMLKVLFGKSFEGTSNDQQILKLAKGVNDQWIQSKNAVAPGGTPVWEFERQASLKAVAEEIFGKWDAENVNNPFNRILPGYETMWRVVLRCVLEISSTRHPATTTDAWKERLASFIQDPTRNQLQKQKNPAGLTAEHVSFEILRLYPPTRHVARMQTDEVGSGERILTADIELLHHTAPVWGDDPLTFRPERWTTLDGMDTVGYMPFGCSPFNCPAKQHRENKVAMPFGVSMIAVLTGCFIEAMAGEWHLDERHIPPVSQPLCNGRTSYANVSLLRVKSGTADLATNAITDAEKTDAEKTDVEKTDAEKNGTEKTDTERTDANKSDQHKVSNDTKTDPSEVNGSNGQDANQTTAGQQ